MKSRKTKVILFILLLSSVSILIFYKYNFSDVANLKRNIMEPDRIKIYYSGKEMTIDRSDKGYKGILELNRSRLVNPLVAAKFEVKDEASFLASNNTIELSSKYNNGLVFPIDENDIDNLKMSINMIEYLYDNPQEMQYRFSRMYNDSGKYNVIRGVEYTRILYTLTEGKMDLMIFGKEDLLFYGEGIVMNTSNKLNRTIDKMWK